MNPSLHLPFKRYQVNLYGEQIDRKKDDLEFYQCDVDIIDDNILAEAECITIVHHALKHWI